MKITPTNPDKYVKMTEANLRELGSNATARDYAKAARAWMNYDASNGFANPNIWRVDRLVATANELAPNDSYVQMTRARSVAYDAKKASVKGNPGFLKDAKVTIKAIGQSAAKNTENFGQTSSITRQTKKLLSLLK